jgi:superoxide dismutase
MPACEALPCGASAFNEPDYSQPCRHEETSMSFTLPDLPYPYDALQPYMSRETLEYHHDKHHAAYVNTGNNLLKGSELEGKSVEEVVRASYGNTARTRRSSTMPASTTITSISGNG